MPASRRYRTIVSDILLEEEIQPLSDDDLRAGTLLSERLAGNLANQRPILDEILPEAFAVVREAAKRVLGMRHDVGSLVGWCCMKGRQK